MEQQHSSKVGFEGDCMILSATAVSVKHLCLCRENDPGAGIFLCQKRKNRDLATHLSEGRAYKITIKNHLTVELLRFALLTQAEGLIKNSNAEEPL